MKNSILVAAALAAGAMIVPATASADPGQTSVTRTTVTRTSDTDRRSDGGQRWRWKTQCTTQWRHGRKIRQCRKVHVRW
jgi:hypothetical protein